MTPDPLVQIAAGISLIHRSRLLAFNRKTMRFRVALNSAEFETVARRMQVPFGRVMLWVLFSTGAEYLLKGAMMSRAVLKPETKDKVTIPNQGSLSDAWLDEAWCDVMRGASLKTSASDQRFDFKTLGGLQEEWLKLEGLHLAAREAPTPDSPEDVLGRKTLRVAYALLAKTIRNRDAHAYVPNERQAHHHLVEFFAAAFNRLMGYVQPRDYDGIRRRLRKAPIDSPLRPSLASSSP